MPSYTFECENGHIKEIKTSEFWAEEDWDIFFDLDFRCHCGSGDFSRVYDPPNIKFKGKGFYKTNDTE